jgi:hypothetical protein
MKRQTVTASLTVTLSDDDDLEGMVNAWYQRDILPNICPASKPVMEVISVEGLGDLNEDTLGPCGCVDYHLADCPLRTDR